MLGKNDDGKLLLILHFPHASSAVHVHNDFLLAILTRCQIIVSTPGMITSRPLSLFKLVDLVMEFEIVYM